MELKLIEYSEQFLERSWYWLNDSEIKFLTNSPSFSKEEQMQWYVSLRNRTDYLIWGLLIGEVPAGVCGLKHLTSVDCEYWGYIGEKKFWGKGYGGEMLQMMIDKAVDLNLKSIWLSVIEHNKRAISLYKKFGFEIERKENDQLLMRKFLLG